MLSSDNGSHERTEKQEKKREKKVLRKSATKAKSTSSDIPDLLGSHASYYDALRAKVGSRQQAQSSSLSSRQEWWIIFFVRFLAYAIPLSFLLYVLYYNYLPFGYDKTFVINVGEVSALNSNNELYLQPSQELSEPTTTPDETKVRYLNGGTNLIFKPRLILNNTKISLDIIGDGGVKILPPDFFVTNFEEQQWQYFWDFKEKIPDSLNGDAFKSDEGAYFNGNTTLEYASSSDILENGTFSIYTEWLPTDPDSDSQQIIGHFNWELWQNKDSVEFRVGRMTDASGPIFNIKQQVDSDFFNSKHSVLLVYSDENQGYIEMYLDNKFSKRISLNGYKIWKDYSESNLTWGWTLHNFGKNNHFTGYIYKTYIANRDIINSSNSISFYSTDQKTVTIPIISYATSSFNLINLNVKK